MPGRTRGFHLCDILHQTASNSCQQLPVYQSEARGKHVGILALTKCTKVVDTRCAPELRRRSRKGENKELLRSIVLPEEEKPRLKAPPCRSKTVRSSSSAVWGAPSPAILLGVKDLDEDHVVPGHAAPEPPLVLLQGLRRRD